MPSRRLSGGHILQFSQQDAHHVHAATWYPHTLSGITYVRSGPNKDPKYDKVMFHRVVLGLTKGERQNVDHINGSGLDNRRENLRLCDQSQNIANSRKKKPTAKSPYKGVVKCATGWRADGTKNGVVYRLGVYDTAKDAAHAYDNWARAFHGEFSHLNFPDHHETPQRRTRKVSDKVLKAAERQAAFDNLVDEKGLAPYEGQRHPPIPRTYDFLRSPAWNAARGFKKPS
jgi:hypothetical protein